MGISFADAAATVSGLADRIPANERAETRGPCSPSSSTASPSGTRKRVVFGGAANLAAPDFGKGMRDVLEALEETSGTDAAPRRGRKPVRPEPS